MVSCPPLVNVRLAELVSFMNFTVKCGCLVYISVIVDLVLCTAVPGVKPNHLIRHTSCDSVDSINSQSSTGSLASQQSALTYADKKKLTKKKSWVCFA